MTFAWPHLLCLLAAPFALLAWELASKRRAHSPAHPKILRAEAGVSSLTLTQPASLHPPGSRLSARRLWFCGGLALAITALARPQWGRIDEPLFNESREIVLAMDISRSMLTPDVAPSRLEREKLLVQSLLDRLAGERVGLIVFSGTAFLQSPLSADYEIIREFLPSLGPDFLPVDGTNYGAMIDAAAGAFEGGTDAGRFLIVLSDGGANDEDWRDHVGKLKDKGIRVIGLGVGTAGGGFIPDVGGGFMKDDRGAVVLAKLESGTLRELANRTGGVYRDAGEWVDLPGLLKSTVESGRKGQFVEKSARRLVERYQWALAPALFCLLMSFWREFPVRPKPRDVMLKSGKALQGAAALVLFSSPFFILRPSALAATAAADSPEPGALLGRIVGRLSEKNDAGALDWAELGNETITWGRQFQSAHQAVPPGPVRDALAAVDAGSALDASAANWPRLRSDLESLLKKPEEQKEPDQRQNQQQNQKQNQQQKQQDSSQQQQKSNQSSQQERQRPKPNPGAPKPATGSESALGDMKAPKPPPSGDMQRIGGSTERKTQDPARADPALAIPLQKLGQLRNQDSPADLYRMIENKEPQPPPADNGKKW